MSAAPDARARARGTTPAAMCGVLTVPVSERAVVVLAGAAAAAAGILSRARLATLLMDPLTPGDDGEVVRAIDRVVADATIGDLPPSLRELPFGCFGAAAPVVSAVLTAAIERADRVGAVVVAGPLDRAGEELRRAVEAPVLVIDGGEGEARAAELAREWFLRHLVAQR